MSRDLLLDAVLAFAALLRARARLARERSAEASAAVEPCRSRLDAAERAFLEEAGR